MKILPTMAMASLMVLGLSSCAVHKGSSGPDWDAVSVPEEGGLSFERITEDNDAVCGRRNGRRRTGIFDKKADLTHLDWWVNPQIAVSPLGDKIAYINDKNNTTNIMVKSASRGGASVQRTFRTSVTDFSWSKDGKDLCFTEDRGGHFGLYLVDAAEGSVVHQVNSGTDNDFGGSMSRDCRNIFFHRGEGPNTYSIWSYDRQKNLFSNYSRGMTPVVDPHNSDIIYCARFTNKRESEIWRINFRTGTEEIILSQTGRCFTTPQISPDGNWILVTGSSLAEKDNIVNTDIFVVRTDGSQFTQLTYHPGNDLSAVWAPDGRTIYFLSQRGSADKVYNVWSMPFTLGGGSVYTPASTSSSQGAQYNSSSFTRIDGGNSKPSTNKIINSVPIKTNQKTGKKRR